MQKTGTLGEDKCRKGVKVYPRVPSEGIGRLSIRPARETPEGRLKGEWFGKRRGAS